MSIEERNQDYGQMLGRISTMIPCEFFQTTESTTEDAVALLLERYYSEMATKLWELNEERSSHERRQG
jgi:hypothetical protein